jgi:hypothetical protein
MLVKLKVGGSRLFVHVPEDTQIVALDSGLLVRNHICEKLRGAI